MRIVFVHARTRLLWRVTNNVVSGRLCATELHWNTISRRMVDGDGADCVYVSARAWAHVSFCSQRFSLAALMAIFVFMSLASVWLIGFTPLQCPMLICFDALRCMQNNIVRGIDECKKRYTCECVNFWLGSGTYYSVNANARVKNKEGGDRLLRIVCCSNWTTRRQWSQQQQKIEKQIDHIEQKSQFWLLFIVTCGGHLLIISPWNRINRCTR